MNTRSNSLRLITLSGLAIGTALASTALALEWRLAEPDDLKGDFKQPLKEVRGEKIQSQTMITESDGKNSYSLRINGDDVSAEVNGEKVPAERIRRKDGKIEILDANGGVVKTFSVMTGDGITVQGFGLENMGNAEQMRREIERQMAGVRDGRVWVGELQGKAGDGARREIRITGDGKGGFKVDQDGDKAMRWSTAPGGKAQGGLTVANSNPPPVMIGITMSEPEDSVLEFINLENAIRVDRVVEGLPGAQGGLQSGDLIIEVKGEKGVSQERLREILRNAKPGDELALKVARKGNQNQDITVKLAPFDQSKLGTTVVPGVNLLEDVEVLRPAQTRKWDDAQKQLEAAMKALKENPNLQPESLKKQLDEALTKASEALKSAQGQMRDGMNEMRFRLNQDGDENVMLFRSQDGERIARLREIAPLPGTPGTPRVEVRGMRLDSDQRMENLERKIEDMNKRLDEIRDLLKESKGR
ncbi:MAG: PDZ domain-containing protein [Planctomycetes bacterium]|nr:PDZ domain-containing protein [Planctomycetota bacterium]